MDLQLFRYTITLRYSWFEVQNIPVKSHNCVVASWTSYPMRKIVDCAYCRQLQRKPLVSNPVMHHGTYITHLPRCMSGSLSHGGGKNFPGIPSTCTTRSFTNLARGPSPLTRTILKKLLWGFSFSGVHFVQFHEQVKVWNQTQSE